MDSDILRNDLMKTIQDLKEQIRAKDKWISELLKKVECPTCGSTELICGHNGEKGCCAKGARE